MPSVKENKRWVGSKQGNVNSKQQNEKQEVYQKGNVCSLVKHTAQARMGPTCPSNMDTENG